MAKFTITNTKTGKEDILDIDKDVIVIGRHHVSDIMLDSKTVSRKHAEITRKKNNYFIADFESGNGTILNGEKLKPHEKKILKTDDIIRIEEFEIHPIFPEKAEGTLNEDTDSGIIEIKMIKKVLSAIDSEKFPTLEGAVQPVEGKKVTFTDDIQELVIGRDPNCEFPIDLHVISRRHAVLHKKWGGVTITDLKSKNGTFVNNQRVEEKLLKNGDTVTLGNIKFLFRNPQEVDVEAISREYEKKAALQEKADKKEPPKPKVSDEAKISLESDRKEKEPDKKEVRAAPFSRKNAIDKITSRFSFSEMIMLGAGIVVLIFTLIILSMFL